MRKYWTPVYTLKVSEKTTNRAQTDDLLLQKPPDLERELTPVITWVTCSYRGRVSYKRLLTYCECLYKKSSTEKKKIYKLDKEGCELLDCILNIITKVSRVYIKSRLYGYKFT